MGRSGSASPFSTASSPAGDSYYRHQTPPSSKIGTGSSPRANFHHRQTPIKASNSTSQFSNSWSGTRPSHSPKFSTYYEEASNFASSSHRTTQHGTSGSSYFSYEPRTNSRSPGQTSFYEPRPSSTQEEQPRRRQSSTVSHRRTGKSPVRTQSSNTRKTAKSQVPKATEADAQRHGIPSGYSLRNWDPNEEPILLLGSVFDANSLGKWIYDWTVYSSGPASPLAEMAGELWLLMIQVSGKTRRAEQVFPRVNIRDSREMIEDFIHSGERVMEKLQNLLKRCENPMLKAAKAAKGEGSQLSSASGQVFVQTLFGRDGELEKTEKLMQSMRLWNIRFEANCEEILKNPGRRGAVHFQGNTTTLAPPLPVSKTEKQPKTNQTNDKTPAERSIDRESSSEQEKAQVMPEDSDSVNSPPTSSAAISSDDTDEDGPVDFLPFAQRGAEQVLPVDHPFQKDLAGLIDIAIKSYSAWRRHGAGDSQQSKETTSKRKRGNDNKSGKSSKNTTGDHGADENDDNNDNDDDDNKSHKRARGPAGSTILADPSDTSPLLACPYYKHDLVSHERCLLVQLKRVKDVKQHLRRSHAQPWYCPICGESSSTQADLNRHVKARACEPTEFTEPEGITEEHRLKFAQRVGRTLSLAEQWFTVWDILFPGLARPESPFVDQPVNEICSEVIRWYDRHGERIVSSYLQSSYGRTQLQELMNTLNYERDLTTLLTTVGRRTLESVVEKMRLGMGGQASNNKDDDKNEDSNAAGSKSSSSAEKSCATDVATRDMQAGPSTPATTIDDDKGKSTGFDHFGRSAQAEQHTAVPSASQFDFSVPWNAPTEPQVSDTAWLTEEWQFSAFGMNGNTFDMDMSEI